MARVVRPQPVQLGVVVLPTRSSSVSLLSHGARLADAGVTDMRDSIFLKSIVEPWDQLLSDGEREHELGADDQKLGQKSLEECT